MLIAERHTRLKELLARRGVCDLKSLAAELDVSHSTVRRDIDVLEQQGLVQQTHGGVIWVGGDKSNGAGGADDRRHPRAGQSAEAGRRLAGLQEHVGQPETSVVAVQDSERLVPQRERTDVSRR